MTTANNVQRTNMIPPMANGCDGSNLTKVGDMIRPIVQHTSTSRAHRPARTSRRFWRRRSSATTLVCEFRRRDGGNKPLGFLGSVQVFVTVAGLVEERRLADQELAEIFGVGPRAGELIDGFHGPAVRELGLFPLRRSGAQAGHGAVDPKIAPGRRVSPPHPFIRDKGPLGSRRV